MFAGQELLPRCSLTERVVPVVSARVSLFGPMTGCLRGRYRRWAPIAAKLPNQSCAIGTNCVSDQRKNGDANGCFWLGVTILRMNTCTKKGRGVGCDSPLLLHLAERLRSAAPWHLLGAACFGFKGAAFRYANPRRRAIAPPTRLRYSAAQGSDENV